MKAILIDDEVSVRDHMKAMLRVHAPEVRVIGEAEGVSSGLALLEREQPDLILLDVEIKEGTGFDLLARMGAPSFAVIFVTGHDHYAIKAFKYSAVDYLLKPVDPTELVQAIGKVRATPWQQQTSHLGNLIDNRTKSPPDKRIVLKDADSVHLVAIKEIIRCEADNNYTRFFLQDGRSLLISRTLREYERLFDDQPFFRVHQSHLINLAFFSRYDRRDGGTLLLQDGSSLPLATRKKEAFFERLERL